MYTLRFGYLRVALTAAIFSLALPLTAQVAPKWNTNGNAIGNNDFLGTTNNQPLVFYTNNQETMRLKANGELRVNSLGGGTGFVRANNNGVLSTTPFTNDTTQVLTGDGSFRSVYAMTGWARAGANLYTTNHGFVGIGTSSPQYLLDVNGDVCFRGTINAYGLNLVNKLEADTIKSVTIIDVGNTVTIKGGATNETYTRTGDLRVQSHSGNNGNLILGAGITGNVGIGTFSPQYKLDVNGVTRFTGDVHVSRLRPLPGDSVVIIGDSSIWISGNNRIYPSASGTIRGLGIGNATATGIGLFSVAIGSKVTASSAASNAIVMGNGGSGVLLNAFPNTLMIGFNSNLPTLFVGPANGAGTTGKVGIGTTAPQADFQVGNGWTKVTAGPAPNVATTFSTAYLGFNAALTTSGWQAEGNGFGNGGVVLLNDLNGGLRVANLPKTGVGTQTLTNAQLQSNTLMYLRSDGRVMIGKDQITPGGTYDDNFTRLTVDGRIMCKDVVVSLTADWPDYVFDSAYVLLPMDSLGQFVTANRHLPGTRTAAQQQANGVSLSETCRMQQQQIEELTLYILQLNERLKALEAEKQTGN